MPIKEDAVLTADVGLSTYTSAVQAMGIHCQTGASTAGRNNNNNYTQRKSRRTPPQGSPWIASTGASRKDVLTTVNVVIKKQ